MPGICHRCYKQVFAAEERRALGRSWHVHCYCCATCGVSLDSMRLEEHRDLDDIYCNACYRRLFATICYGISRHSFTAVKICNCCGNVHKRGSFCPNQQPLAKKRVRKEKKTCGCGDHDKVFLSESKEKYE